jgi:hypothetical protein
MIELGVAVATDAAYAVKGSITISLSRFRPFLPFQARLAFTRNCERLGPFPGVYTTGGERPVSSMSGTASRRLQWVPV